MLVLSRKNQESLFINDGQSGHRPMKIVVLSISGNRVKLGFDIDSDVEVNRMEVWEQIQSSRRNQRVDHP